MKNKICFVKKEIYTKGYLGQHIASYEEVLVFSYNYMIKLALATM